MRHLPRCAAARIILPALLGLAALAIHAGAPDRFEVSLGEPEVIPIPASPVRYYANDSRFPYLPDSNGLASIAFWVCGANYRSKGPSLDRMGPIDPTNAVLSGTPGQFDNGGAWLLNAIRRPDGVLVGFYHAEDHSCVPYTEWNSTGVALSRDDGATFAKRGQIIGQPNPCRGFGGLAANTVVWDEPHRRWLAWGGAYVFASTDPDAAPGTWRGYDTNGAFTVAMPCADLSLLGRAPGLDGHGPSQSATWNTYLNSYLMIYTRWGNERDIFLADSPDGLAWTAQRRPLYTAPPGEQISYPLIIGTTAEQSGREAWLVCMRQPSTQAGCRRDMVRRPIRFSYAAPAAGPRPQ